MDKNSNEVSKAPRVRTPATKAAHDVSLFKLKQREAERMASVDFHAILEALAEGKTQTEIAKAHNLNASTLSIWLNTRTGNEAEALRLSRQAGAGACMDKALHALESCLGTDNNAAVTLGAHLAKHWQLRASLFDRKTYQERVDLNATTPSTAQTLPSFSITIMHGTPNEPITIEATND